MIVREIGDGWMALRCDGERDLRREMADSLWVGAKGGWGRFLVPRTCCSREILTPTAQRPCWLVKESLLEEHVAPQGRDRAISCTTQLSRGYESWPSHELGFLPSSDLFSSEFRTPAALIWKAAGPILARQRKLTPNHGSHETAGRNLRLIIRILVSSPQAKPGPGLGNDKEKPNSNQVGPHLRRRCRDLTPAPGGVTRGTGTYSPYSYQQYQ